MAECTSYSICTMQYVLLSSPSLFSLLGFSGNWHIKAIFYHSFSMSKVSSSTTSPWPSKYTPFHGGVVTVSDLWLITFTEGQEVRWETITTKEYGDSAQSETGTFHLNFLPPWWVFFGISTFCSVNSCYPTATCYVLSHLSTLLPWVTGRLHMVVTCGSPCKILCGFGWLWD